MQHPIRLFIGIVLVCLGIMGIWTASKSSQPVISNNSPNEIFSPSPTPIPATLTNAFWQATLIGDQPALSEAPITLVFTAENNLTGSDGCNTFQTEYETRDNSSITIANVFTATQKTCSEALQTQAQQFISLLTQADRYEILGSNLNLLIGDQVALIMTARTDPLIGNWQVDSMLDEQNQVMVTLPGTNLSMEFTPNNTVFGSSGCNTYTAEYTSLGGELTINQPATTEMFCDTPAGISDQEQQFLSNLGRITGYQSATNQMILTNTDNQAIISLVTKPVPGGLTPLME